MQINWANYKFLPYDGYGRYGLHMVRALARRGVAVHPLLEEQLSLPGWLNRLAGLDFSNLTVSCMPPIYLHGLPGRQWLLSMCEGTKLVDGWADHVNQKAERLIVPCQHNAAAFERSGVTVPIHVVPGGTSPAEFPVRPPARRNGRPYTFLALADRGGRKGWIEVYDAFYKAFQGQRDVRLVIKARPAVNELATRVAGATHRDPRVTFWFEDVASMADVYAQVDCFAIPSRSEGWGMPHREAAMMGLPVITTRYSGLDDGYTECWSLPVETYRHETVPDYAEAVRGEWVRADVKEVAARMRWCYEHPEEADTFGQAAATWLRENQTWDHAAVQFEQLLERYG